MKQYNNFINVVENPYELIHAVKRKCISLHHYNILTLFCVLDYKPLLYKARVDGNIIIKLF